jgi:hypothetical protein
MINTRQKPSRFGFATVTGLADYRRLAILTYGASTPIMAVAQRDGFKFGDRVTIMTVGSQIFATGWPHDRA